MDLTSFPCVLIIILAIGGGPAPVTPQTCRSDEFQCRSSECIRDYERCDNVPNCADGSDEVGCNRCDPNNEIDCGRGLCIAANKRCDGTRDCPDNRDEDGCPANCDLRRELDCGRGQCIPLNRRCDGRRDCPDNRDEIGCGCDPNNEIDCGRGRCISLDKRCNGVRDCPDNRDEDGCELSVSVEVRERRETVEEGSQARFQCIASCPASVRDCTVRWGFNSQSSPLPAGVTLVDPFVIQFSPAVPAHSGRYYCWVDGFPQTTAFGELTVNPVFNGCRGDEYTCDNSRCVPRDYLCDGKDDCGDDSDEFNCNRQCDPTEMRCNNGRNVQKIWACDGDDDCKDGTEEQLEFCPAPLLGSSCARSEHECDSRNQCVPRSYLCDGQVDCLDRSDEVGCAPPTVTRPPVRELSVRIGATIVLTCTAIGKPSPLINWRLNWGCIPSGPRVTVTSVNGVGTLTIRNARRTDAGAYTCEAINNQQSIFGNPDAIVSVIGVVPPTLPPPTPRPLICPRGSFNDQARVDNECIDCWCSGLSSVCRSSKLGWYQFSDHDGVVLADKRGTPLSPSLYRYDPRYRRNSVPNYRLAPSGDLYWKLPESFRGKMLVTYGGLLRYNVEYETRGGGQPSRSYDVIIRGRDRTAYCRVSSRFQPGGPQLVSFQVVENSCVTDGTTSSSDLNIPVPITRPMFMEILVDVQDLLIRATYSSGQSSVSISEISIQRGEPSGGGGQAVTVEHCDNCPIGYTGMSCEDCASGYRRRLDGRFPRGVCEAIGQDPPCNPAGTQQKADGRCYCKPFVTGTLCDQCKAQTYLLDSSNREGCTECFCMGVTADCTGSNLRRETIRSSLAIADWALVDTGNNPVAQDVLSSNGREVVADLRSLGNGSYYWRLPIDFVGNKLGAYGGTLRFNTKFIAPSVDRPNIDPDLIMFGAEGIQLTASFENIRLDRRQHDAQVKMVVNRWSRVDGAVSSREHFLMALTGIRDILVKASFTLDTREARISDVTLDVASQRGTGDRALEVEQCNCPAEYTGLSCENCMPGYTRAAGVYLGVCNKCDCNGHSSECDNNRGYCLNCAHGTTGRYCERCATGYERNANDGSSFECIRPSTLVTIPEPVITVTVGGRAVLECRAFAPDLPTRSIIWKRDNGLGLPRTSSQPQLGRLVIDDVQPSYAGGYTCTITTVGGIVGNGIASLVVITDRCPRGYTSPPSCDICDRGFSRDRSGRCVLTSVEQIEVTIRPTSLTINEGESIRLTCTARSQVDSSVYLVVWQREGGRLPSRANTFSGELIIRDAQVGDSGVYSCTGSSPLATRTERVTVDVRPRSPPPTVMTVSVEPTSLYLQEGTSDVVRCIVTGDARLVEWRRGSGRPLAPKHEVSRTRVEGDTLRIVRMDVNDRGYYYCTALGADAVTRVESRPPVLVDFQRGPETIRSFVDVVTPDVKVSVGDTARLECRVDNSVSANSIQWSRQDRIRMGIRYRQSNGVLILRSAEQRDSGTFICTVRTTDGREQRESARLTVERIVPPREDVRVNIVGGEAGNLRYSEGDRIDLLCRLTSGSPSSVISWQFSGGSWPSNVQRTGSQIYIPAAVEANTGMYTCVGEDGFSTDRQQVYVDVSQRDITIDIPNRYDVELGDDVIMECKVPEEERRRNSQIRAYWKNDRGQRLTPPTLQQSDLKIDSVDFTHAGNYTCILEAEGFSTSRMVMLVVRPRQNGLIFWRQNPVSVKRLIGQSVSFDCAPTTLLPTTSKWERENSVNLPSGAFQSGSKLLFRNLRYSDAGTYTCTARNSLGSAQLHVTLVVEGPPGVPVMSVNGQRLDSVGVKTCNSGETITINCLAEGSPAPKYIWSRMLAQGGFQYITSGGNLLVDEGSLRIYDIRKADEGYYNCSAQNALGSKETYTKIVVELGNVVPTNAIVRGSGSGSRRDMYTAGRTALLRCDASSPTPVTYSWSFSGGAMPGNAQANNAVLLLTNLRRSNQGTYSCIVRNEAGNSQPASAQVFVSGGVDPGVSRLPSTPIAERSQYSSPVRGTIRMRCQLPANADRIEWTRDRRLPLPTLSTLYDRGQLIQVTDVRPEDGGTYYCSAVNSAGQSTSAPITVLISELLPAKPNSASPSTDIFVYPGNDVYMSCKTTDNSVIVWSRRGGQLPASAKTDSGPGWARLVISDIKAEDAGVYMCQASNEYGKSEPLLHTLEVGNERPALPAPVVSGDNDFVYGEAVELSCNSAQSQPARYTWTKQDGEMPRDSQIAGGVLTINNFRPEDAGVYTCTSTNAAGISSASIRLSGRTASTPLTVKVTPRGTLTSSSRPDDYLEDTRLELLCEPSNAKALVAWSRPGNDLPAHASQSGSTLVFESLEEIDSDYYRCTANYGGSEVYQDYGFFVTASVIGDPISKVSIDVQPGILLEEGSSVQLTCSADGDAVYYEWRRTSGQLSDRANVKDNVLMITDFESSDEGEYVCSASNNFGPTRNARTTLTMRRDVIVPLSAPKLRFLGAQTYGGSVVIVCSSTEDNVYLEIEKGGFVVSRTNREGEMDARYRIGALKEIDFGLYKCTASRGRLSKSTEVYLSVPGAPPPEYAAVRPPQAMVTEGDNFQFECLAFGVSRNSDAIMYNWTKVADDLANNTKVVGNILYFMNVTEENVGNYTCVAYNGNGAAQAIAPLTLAVTELPDNMSKVTNETTSGTNFKPVTASSNETTMVVTSTTVAALEAENLTKLTTLQSEVVTTSIKPENSVTKLAEKTTTAPQMEAKTMSTFVTIPPTGPPSITSCRAIRTAGDTCLLVLEADLDEAVIDCRANGAPVIKYQWTRPGNATVLSTESVLTVPVEDNFQSDVYICTASNSEGTDTESWRLVKNAFLPGFVDENSYYELPPIADPYLLNTVDISFTPSDDTGLLLYSSQASESSGGDLIGLGLEEGTVVFKLNLGTGLENVPSSAVVKLNEPNRVQLTRNKKYVTLVVNGERSEYTSTGEFEGLNLEQPLYVAGVPEGMSNEYGRSFSGVVNSLIVQGKPVVYDLPKALESGIVIANSCVAISCDNNGECVSAYNSVGYECICPEGFAGSMCSVVGEACYPGYCSNDGQCTNTDMGPLCTCRLGYAGQKCEQDAGIDTPAFNGDGYIHYAPLTDAMRSIAIEVVMKINEEADGLIAYAGENQFGTGDYIALLLRNSSVVFTFDLGEGPAVITSNTKIEPGKYYRIEAERTDTEGSLIIDGGIAVKASSVERSTTTTQASGGWLFSGGSNSDNNEEDTANGASVGLNVKTPLFVGGVSKDYLLPDVFNVSGLSGCISKVVISNVEINLISDADGYGNVTSCSSDSGVQNDDPCLKLPCGSKGRCSSSPKGGFVCTCDPGYIGELCDVKKTACSTDFPCKNGGICEPMGEDDFKCRCIVGWIGETCEISEGNQGLAFAHGANDDVVLPLLSPNSFSVLSKFSGEKRNSSAEAGRHVSPGRRRHSDATRPRDFFRNYFYRRLKGARDNTITSGKRACFGGGGYLEMLRDILPTSAQEMKVKLTVRTTSTDGVLYWQGQSALTNGAGQDFFGVGLVDGYVKFSFELGGGPAVLMSTVKVNDGTSHVVLAERRGQQGILQIDEEREVRASSGGALWSLNSDGNAYIGGVPHHKRMVSSVFKPGFDGCISHVKTSGVAGAIDLFKTKISGVDVSDE